MPSSVHTERWLSQFPFDDWDIYFFPVYISDPLKINRKATIFLSKIIFPKKYHPNNRYIWWSSIFFRIDSILKFLFRRRERKLYQFALEIIIRFIKPDIIHTLETQHSGYLALNLKRKLKARFPIWLLSIWGSDLYLFSRLGNHQLNIKNVLAEVDGYSSACHRDLPLGKCLGFKGKAFSGIPSTGGFDFEELNKIRKILPISSRKKIVLKGQESWSGRALFGLRALNLCSDLLTDYEIMVYSASADVKIAAELFSQDTGVQLKIIEHSSHDFMLEIFGQARVAIGLGISDGLPNTMTEAMAMGAFPIQSGTSCANEIIENGKNGFIVPPEDPQEIVKAIIKALTDDDLVNAAAELNHQVLREKLDISIIRDKTIKMYMEMLIQKR